MEQLSRTDLERIVKILAATNNGKLEFDQGYLKLGDKFDANVKQDSNTLTIDVAMKERV